ncbi:hypothetical protein [Brevibacillus sp. BC25]|uniref:hypothetical protein n=1 Tax=Brevibacillus sp. BC25 TaxID=1144308 RepID=UPI000270DDFF|nr:hypothetical protein [Brevibacillus sp. BC25]EJL25886.1 hypothetical protein PMI05_03624 [Brevibacillus sp. BC25]
MGTTKESDALSHDQPDVYERARLALDDLIEELCEALEVEDTESYKRKGYEMIGSYFREPVNTGELTLIYAAVLAVILYKLELTQQGENVAMVRDQYSMMKKDD